MHGRDQLKMVDFLTGLLQGNRISRQIGGKRSVFTIQFPPTVPSSCGTLFGCEQ